MCVGAAAAAAHKAWKRGNACAYRGECPFPGIYPLRGEAPLARPPLTPSCFPSVSSAPLPAVVALRPFLCAPFTRIPNFFTPGSSCLFLPSPSFPFVYLIKATRTRLILTEKYERTDVKSANCNQRGVFIIHLTIMQQLYCEIEFIV